jgi:hypothetical protein
LKEEKITQAWREYQQGIEYKQQIDLYDEVDENYNFFWGDQWKGINTAGLPTPVFNTIKPMIKFMVVQVKDRKLSINFTADGVYKEDNEKDIQAVVTQVSDYAKFTWNRLNMEAKNLEGLENAAITGDYILYHWWDDSIETGQPFKGDINSQIIDNVNYCPGNPNNPDVQSQPYIILVFREMVETVREHAKKNGIPKAEIEMITPDEETEYTAGDPGKIELSNHGKCNVLLRMWKENGTVHFAKYTKTATVQKPTDAKIRRYPIAMMNWTKRKNCCHGIAEVTYQKANQVYINKQMAFTQLYLLQTAYPKVLFDKTVIREWTNKVAGAIGVNGNTQDAARYMQPPQIPFDVWKGAEFTMRTMMELAGANDAALGNISNPDNTSAFIAIREAAVVPLQAQEERFRQMMRDMGLIWFEFWLANYPEDRQITFEYQGEKQSVEFELSRYKDLVFDVKIDVGESAMWSEITTVQTLDKLLQAGMITLSDYLEALPDGYIPNRTQMLEKAKQREAMQMQAMQEQEAQENIELPEIPNEGVEL